MIIQNTDLIDMVQLSLVMVITSGLLLAEIVVATGLIMKQFMLLKGGKDPMQATKITKPVFISEQAAKLAREAAIAKQMELG